jgi:hypothetical protein
MSLRALLRQPFGTPGTGGTWLKKGSGAKQSPPFRCHCEPCKGEAISSLACDVTLANTKQHDQPEDCFVALRAPRNDRLGEVVILSRSEAQATLSYPKGKNPYDDTNQEASS